MSTSKARKCKANWRRPVPIWPGSAADCEVRRPGEKQLRGGNQNNCAAAKHCMRALAVDAERLPRQIDALAAISEAAPPVVTRVLFSGADLEGRAFVKKICQDTCLSLREDAIGNLFARWKGQDAALP